MKDPFRDRRSLFAEAAAERGLDLRCSDGEQPLWAFYRQRQAVLCWYPTTRRWWVPSTGERGPANDPWEALNLATTGVRGSSEPGPHDPVRVTEALLARVDLWTRERLALLGVPFPPPPDWRRTVIGTLLQPGEAQALLGGRNLPRRHK